MKAAHLVLSGARRHVKIIQWCVAIIAVSFFLWQTALEPLIRQQRGYGQVDFAVFYVAGSSVTKRLSIAPEQLYMHKVMRPVVNAVRTVKGGTKYLYLPQAALIFAPLSVLPFAQAVNAWILLNAALALGAFYGTILLLRDTPVRIRYSLVLLALSASDTVAASIVRGQVNIFVWAVMIGSTALLSRNKQVLAGVSMAIASILKLFPGLFFFYYLMKKQWVAAASFAATHVFAALGALALFGWGGIQRFLNILPGLLSGSTVGNVRNSTSLFGSFRMVVREGAFDWMGIKRAVIIHLGENAHLVLVVAGVFGLLWFWHINRRHRTAPWLVVEYSSIILFVLLFAKSIHADFHIWMIPVVLFLLHMPFRWRTVPYWLVVIALFVSTQWWSVLPIAKNDVVFGLKVPTAGLLAAFSVVLMLLVTRRGHRFMSTFHMQHQTSHEQHH